MEEEFAKKVLDFLAQKAGKDSCDYDVLELHDCYVYGIFIEESVEDSYFTYHFSTGSVDYTQFEASTPVFKRPYTKFLKMILDFSKSNETVYYDFWNNGIFLKPGMTLEKILIEMDLEGL